MQQAMIMKKRAAEEKLRAKQANKRVTSKNFSFSHKLECLDDTKLLVDAHQSVDMDPARLQVAIVPSNHVQATLYQMLNGLARKWIKEFKMALGSRCIAALAVACINWTFYGPGTAASSALLCNT